MFWNPLMSGSGPLAKQSNDVSWSNQAVDTEDWSTKTYMVFSRTNLFKFHVILASQGRKFPKHRQETIGRNPSFCEQWLRNVCICGHGPHTSHATFSLLLLNCFLSRHFSSEICSVLTLQFPMESLHSLSFSFISTGSLLFY